MGFARAGKRAAQTWVNGHSVALQRDCCAAAYPRCHARHVSRGIRRAQRVVYCDVDNCVAGNFIMQVVDIQAFSVMFAACSRGKFYNAGS